MLLPALVRMSNCATIKNLAIRHADECWQEHSTFALIGAFINPRYPPYSLRRKRSQTNRIACDYVTAPRPGPFRSAVRIIPSLTRKIPGNFCSQGLFAIGMYWRALASTAVTPGT